MNQIHLKKSEKDSKGNWSESRTITLSPAIWARVQKKNDPNTKWELVSSVEAPKAKELMKKAVSTKVETTVESEAVEENVEVIDYSNYSLDELREACKNAEIKFSNVDKEASLIKKLNKHESGSN